jgi:hypothetical protein
MVHNTESLGLWTLSIDLNSKYSYYKILYLEFLKMDEVRKPSDSEEK